jgi:hypothetical protein
MTHDRFQNKDEARLDFWFDHVKNVAVELAYDTEVAMQMFLLQPNGRVDSGPMQGDPQVMLQYILNKERPEGFVMVCEARYKVCECADKHGPEEGCTGTEQRGSIANDVNNPEALLVIGMMRGSTPRIEMAEITGEIPDRDVGDWKEDGAVKGALAEIAMEVMK